MINLVHFQVGICMKSFGVLSQAAVKMAQGTQL